MGNSPGLSLRYKLLAALTIIPMVGLSVFLVLAISIFEKDKIAYIFDSSLSVSKNHAARVSAEVSSVVSLTQAIVFSYRANTKDLAESGTYYFDHEAKFDGFRLYAVNPAPGAVPGSEEKTIDLVKASGKATFAESEQEIVSLVNEAHEKPIVMWRPPNAPDKLFLAVRFGDIKDPLHLIAVTLFDASALSEVFSDHGPYQTILSREDGKTIFAFEKKNKQSWSAVDIWQELSKRKTPEGIAELTSPNKIRYLTSFTQVGVADLVVISMVDRASALEAVNILLRKSLIFFLIVICMTAIIAVIASRGLTSSLARLSEATQKIAGGDFEVRVDTKAGGELGALARSFNAMAQEVSRLMLETAEKARMESELATAKTVQETLFPESHADLGTVEIAGYYMPASECGGDWWYYCENAGKVFIWIGDATGHGAPAALLTSAARAVASVINFGPERSVSESLGILNRAICDTSKGKMMMTFFLASIDKQTGLMTYANASHEPPLLLRPTEGEPERGDFIPLNDVNNPRLGEQIDRVFEEVSVQLNPGDRVIFYTDGVTDVKSPEDKTWGERRFLKSLSGGLTRSGPAAPALNDVVAQLENYRSSTPLDDDVTLVICNFGFDKGAA